MNAAYHSVSMSHQMPVAAPAPGLGPGPGPGSAGYPSSMPSMHGYQPPPQSQQAQHHSHHQQQQQQQQQHQQQHQHQHQQQPPPQQNPHQPPPRHEELSAAEQQAISAQMLVPMSRVDEASGRKYHLDVVQQPKRARMCGFGDKDRRPITPPPCVRLVITDVATGKEVDCNDIDHSMFVLNVDLWSEDAVREVNLVRSSTGTPSISSTTPYSYSTLNGSDATPVPYTQQVLPSSRDSYPPSPAVNYTQEYQVQPGYAPVSSAYPPNGSYGPPQQFYPPGISLPSQGAQYSRNGSQSGFPPDQAALRMSLVNGQPSGMFTRNLIGSLAASAFRLSDTSDRIGIWFVLQDLSVRTEGPFRLRFSFVNVGPPSGNSRDSNGSKVINGRAPILASCFSEVFNVYSAKKFPGVCESTPLSKTFATQGIKIPIRKDANMKGGDGGEDDYGD